jgi:hypothetical protein
MTAFRKRKEFREIYKTSNEAAISAVICRLANSQIGLDALYCFHPNNSNHKGACGRVRLHMSHVYSSEDCSVFSEALEHSWRIFLRSGRLTRQNFDIAKAALTRAILDTASSGLRNPRRLAVAACARADTYIDRIRQERIWAMKGAS